MLEEELASRDEQISGLTAERDGLQEKDAGSMHVLAFGDFEKGRQEEQKPGKASCWTVSV